MVRIKHYIKLTRDMLIYSKVLYRKYKAAKFHPIFLANCNYALEELSDPFNVKIYELGEMNKDKVIALIRFPDLWIKTAGFFALFNRTLCALSFCERLGLIPVLENWKDCAYQEDISINGYTNVFEYYFRPLSDIDEQDAANSYNVIIPSNPNMDIVMHQYNVEKWYAPSEDYIKHMGKIWRKYIHLNDAINTQINADIDYIIHEKNTLGVHFRGTDFKLNVNNHPISISVEDYFYFIDEALDKGGFEQIFLATDDLDAIESFKKRYDNIICYEDVYRTKGDTSVAYSSSNRELHRYKLGYEVVRDMYTLGSCQGLIAGASQVNIAARIYKSSMNANFEYFKLLDKGINKNNVEWIDYYRKNIDKGATSEL